MQIFISAGHGGPDTGAVSQGTTERDELIKIVDSAFDILQNLDTPGAEIIKVPNNLALGETVSYINAHTQNPNTDICIEAHLNSNQGEPGTGTETYYGRPDLAEKMHRVVLEILGLKDRGVKDGNFLYFNNHTKPGSALIELGFINNPADLARVRGEGARAIAEAVARYTGGSAQPTPPPLPPVENYKQLWEEEKRKNTEIKAKLKQIIENN